MEEPSRKRPKKSQKKVRYEKQAARDLEEERLLASSLFGGGASDTSSVLFRRSDSLSKQKPQKKREEALVAAAAAPEFSFEIDRVGDAAVALDEDRENDESSEAEDHDEDASETQDGVAVAAAAWVDDDDDDVELNLVDGNSRLRKLRSTKAEDQPLTGSVLQDRLRVRFQSTTQTTARTDWADVIVPQPATSVGNKSNVSADDDDDDEFKSSSAPLLASSGGGSGRRRLPPNLLNLKRCPDANLSDPCRSVVQAVHFHPGSDPDRPLMLTAGLDKSLRFFHVGEEESAKIHGIHFPNLPIYSASFLGSTGNVVVTGRRPFFYLYDSVAGKLDMVPRIVGREEKSLERCVASPDGRTLAFCGNDGYVILFDAHNKSWMNDFKLNGSVRAITFTPDGDEIIASGSDGDVYRWDLRSKKCLERFSNEDGTITSCLAATSRTLAVGAESGVVNLYSEQRRSIVGSSSRTPIKSIMNLKTAADMVRFNSDGQILALSSRREKKALKLLHVPTATVFANWPTSKTPLGYVWSMDFSPNSRYLAMGNDQGKCLLYKLMHYDNVD